MKGYVILTLLHIPVRITVNDFHQGDIPILNKLQRQLDPNASPLLFDETISFPGSTTCLVARSKSQGTIGQIMGVASLTPVITPFVHYALGYISVRPDFLRCRIGTTLSIALERYALENNLPEIYYLIPEENEPAKLFFSSLPQCRRSNTIVVKYPVK